MTEQIERRVIESYATTLARLWRENMASRGAKAFHENEDARKALLDRAAELGIRDEVFSRANDIIHGR
jgi:hypothetical protein